MDLEKKLEEQEVEHKIMDSENNTEEQHMEQTPTESENGTEEQKLDEPQNQGNIYYLSIAMTIGLHPLTLERQLIFNEITYEQAIDAVKLGIRVYEGALGELDSHGDNVFSMNKEVYCNYLQNSLKDLRDFLSRVDDRTKLPKIEFQEDVGSNDIFLLLDALQKKWFKPKAARYWESYFDFKSKSKDIPHVMSESLRASGDARGLFQKYLLRPGMTTKADFQDLLEAEKMRSARESRTRSRT